MKLLSFINIKRKQLYLFLLPAVVAVLGVMHIMQHPVTHYSGSDPAYAYLINGLTLATGSSDIGHTDNPGTTVQVFEAIVIRFVYLFRSAPSVTDDVIANPELYIMAGRTGMLIVNTLLMVWLGFFVWKRTGGKKWLALGMQTILFYSQYLIIYFALLMPEAFLISGGIVLSGICIHLLHAPELTHRRKIKYAAAFAVVTAFMAVTKFPAIVLFLIPLTLLSGNLYKLIYLVFTFVSAYIFILPARAKISNFFDFIFGILTHKGRYGSGEEGFADADVFLSNIYTHFHYNILYFLILSISLLIILAGFVRYKKWMQPHALKYRLLAGILLAGIANVVMASKAFAYHYLIAVESLSGLAVCTIMLILFSIWPEIKQILSALTKPVVQFSLLGAYSTLLLYLHAPYYNFTFQTQDHSTEVIIAFKQQGKLPAIFSSRYCNGPSPVCGFDFGIAFSGEIRHTFAKHIITYYPDSWIFNPVNGEYKNFLETAIRSDFAKRYPKYLFYMHPSDTTEALAELNKLQSLTDSAGSYVHASRVHQNPHTGEQIWVITSDTTRAAKRFNLVASIVCDFETTQGDSVFTTSMKNMFVGNADLKNNAKARGGKSSLAFSVKESYAGGISLAVAKGMNYEVSIWCKSDTKKRSLNVKSSLINFSADDAVEKTPDGWEKLTLKFSVPQNFEDGNVKLFLWVPEQRGEMVWWDDLEIKVFQ
jgi:hypothetical protein